MGVTLIYLLILLPILSFITILVWMITLGRGKNFLTKWVGYVMGRSTLRVAGVKIKIRYHHKKPEKPAVFLINHSSTLDLFILGSIFLPRICFIAKKELLYNPFFYIIGKFTGQIFIDRNDPRKALLQISEAYKYIRKNQLSLFFAPEGTRSEDGKIGLFKPGAFGAAVELGYPVIPLFLEGAYRLCPGKSLITRPGTVIVHFHKPIDTSGWNKENLREHKEIIREKYLQWNGEKKGATNTGGTIYR